MNNFARMNSDVVAEVWNDAGLGVSPADVFTQELATQFQPCGDDVRAGWSLIGGIWTAPEAGVIIAPNYGSKITVLAFRQRFTMAEKTAIEMAAMDNPAGAQQERLAAASLRAFLSDLAASTLIDLARPDTIAGAQQLEAFSLLADGRAAEIITTPVQWIELPTSIQASMPEPIS